MLPLQSLQFHVLTTTAIIPTLLITDIVASSAVKLMRVMAIGIDCPGEDLLTLLTIDVMDDGLFLGQ